MWSRFRKWLNHSCTPSATPVCPKFGVCGTLRKIQIFFAKLMLKSLKLGLCQVFRKFQSLQIFCKVQIFSPKPWPKRIQNKSVSQITNRFFGFTPLFYNKNLLFHPLFPQKLSVSVSNNVVSYMRNITVWNLRS